MAVDTTILRDSSFSGEGVHGGFHRSMQIKHLLTEAGLKVNETIPHGPGWSRGQRVPAGLRFLLTHRYPIQRSKTEIGHCGISVLRLEQTFREHRGAKVLIWENASQPLVPIIAREHGYRVVAVPHNIESLAGSDLVPGSRLKPLDRMQLEFGWFKECDATFCIGREECWLLANANVNAGYLPYYPPPVLQDRLLNVRQRRQSTVKRAFVMLGTAHNPPTAAGMIQVIRWLQASEPSDQQEVVIAGHGTEMLAEHVGAGSKIRLLGRISDDALDSLLCDSRGMLTHQIKGAGALTRIPEALVAGIPVIANSIASRSAWNLAGMHSYDTSKELHDLMRSALDEAPVLQRPVSAENEFVQTVLRYCDEASTA